MPLLYTFGEVKTSRVFRSGVTSSCVDSDEFASLVNEGTDIALQRGDWPGTVIPMRLQVRQGCIVWPRIVGRIRRINRCRSPMKVESLWWDFVDKENYLGWLGNGVYNFGNNGITGQNLGWGMGPGGISSQGRVPTYNDVPSGNPRYIRAYALGQVDKGKTLTIFGIDGNGQPLRHQDAATGDWLDGVIITLDIPFGSTSTYVQRIDAVLKDETQFNVPLYAYDPITNTMLDLAIYEPTETNPSYAKDRLFAMNSPNCQQEFTVIVLVKLAFLKVKVDTDYVLIPSLMALKQLVQAVKYGEAGDAQNYAIYLQQAIDTLNAVLDNESPVYQNPVDEGFQGQQYNLGYQNVI